MAWNDWIYQNVGADDFMRAARQARSQGIGALGTGDFWQSLGAGTLEGGLTLLPIGNIAKGGKLGGSLVQRATKGFGPKNVPLNLGLTAGVTYALGGTPAFAGTTTPTPAAETDRQGSAQLRYNRQVNRIMSGQQPQPTQTISTPDVSGVGAGEYGAAVGQANSLFDLRKREARNEFRDILTGLGQQTAGGVQDLSMAAAQAGLDTSPGALDVGIESLYGRQAEQEMQARTGLAKAIQKLQMDRAKQIQSAGLARQRAQSAALTSAFQADAERLAREQQNAAMLAYLRSQGVQI